MAANKFVLKHGNIEVDYTLSGSVGDPALNYRDAEAGTISFSAPEISTTWTALGALVSVGLLRTVDTGGESFGMFLPDLDVPPGQLEEFSTVGVYYRYQGPDSVPRRPPSWRTIELRGTAQLVLP
jgi:hypothetical protein